MSAFRLFPYTLIDDDGGAAQTYRNNIMIIYYHVGIKSEGTAARGRVFYYC